MALTDKSSIVVPKGFYGKANVLQGLNPQTESLVDLDVTRNTTATRVNEAGLIESVAANVPRRDFLNGGCGELLVEPQRTNIANYSEDFTQGFSTNNCTITPNTSLAPDGAITADKIEDTNGGDDQKIRYNFSFSAGDTKSTSIFIEKDNDESRYPEFLSIFFSGGTASRVSVQLNTKTGATVERLNDGNGNTHTIEDYGSYWRLTLICVDINDGNTTFAFDIIPAKTNVFNGNSPTTGFITAWGLQDEKGSYPTSYIPTTASAVTRNQDVISATNIGSLLNDAAGGIFVEASPFSEFENGYVGLSNGTSLNRVRFGFSNAGSIALVSVVGGSVQIASTSPSYFANTFYKLGLRYANNDYAVYQDGTSIITDTNALTFPDSTLSNVVLADSVAGGKGSFYGRLRQLVIFDQAPTDAQLTSITS